MLENLRAVLEAGGSSLDRVVKATVYLTDLSTSSKMNEVYAEHLGHVRRTRSTVGVATPPLGPASKSTWSRSRRSGELVAPEYFQVHEGHAELLDEQ